MKNLLQKVRKLLSLNLQRVKKGASKTELSKRSLSPLHKAGIKNRRAFLGTSPLKAGFRMAGEVTWLATPWKLPAAAEWKRRKGPGRAIQVPVDWRSSAGKGGGGEGGE